MLPSLCYVAEMIRLPFGAIELDEERIRSLPAESLRTLSVKLLVDLNEARDRLNQSPENSARSPSSRAPWVERKGRWARPQRGRGRGRGADRSASGARGLGVGLGPDCGKRLQTLRTEGRPDQRDQPRQRLQGLGRRRLVHLRPQPLATRSMRLFERLEP